MAEEHFTVTFAGPALESGAMRVSDLAPSLLAFSEALHRAHALLHPDEPAPHLTVTATREGSFGLDLALVDVPGMVERIRDFLVSDDVTAAANLSQLVTIVLATIEGLKNAYYRARHGDTAADTGTTINFGDNTHIENLNVLGRDSEYRKGLHGFVRPLAVEGIDDLGLDHDGEHVGLSKADLGAFEPPTVPEDVLSDETRTTFLQLDTVSFTEKHKWRVGEGRGGPTFWVAIADESFLRDVTTSRRRFSSGDRLKVRLRTVQYLEDGQLRVRHSIVEVLEQIEGSEQEPLPGV